MYAAAAPEEGGACHVVGGNGEGAFAHAAVGKGGGGDEGGLDLQARVYALREAGDSGRALARRVSRRRASVRSVGGCRRGSEGSGRQGALKKAWSIETCRLAVWDRD